MRMATRYTLGAITLVLLTSGLLALSLVAAALLHLGIAFDRQTDTTLRLITRLSGEPRVLREHVLLPGSDVFAVGTYDSSLRPVFTMTQPGKESVLPNDAELRTLATQTGSVDLGSREDAALVLVEDKSPRHAYVLGVFRDTGLIDDVTSLLSFGWIATVVIAVLAAAAVALLIRGTTRPLRQLTRATEALQRQEFDPSLLARAGRRRDEIGALARHFSQMATDVQQRQLQLQQRVDALEVQIDDGQRQRSVAEITGSDAFGQLESRARALRERRASRSAGQRAEDGRDSPTAG